MTHATPAAVYERTAQDDMLRVAGDSAIQQLYLDMQSVGVVRRYGLGITFAHNHFGVIEGMLEIYHKATSLPIAFVTTNIFAREHGDGWKLATPKPPIPTRLGDYYRSTVAPTYYVEYHIYKCKHYGYRGYGHELIFPVCFHEAYLDWERK